LLIDSHAFIGWALAGLPGTVVFDIGLFGDDYLGVTAQSQYMEEKSAPRKKPMHGREKTVWPMVLAVGASVSGAVGKHWSKHRAKLTNKPPHQGKRTYFMH
jgi:hypothetical protein